VKAVRWVAAISKLEDMNYRDQPRPAKPPLENCNFAGLLKIPQENEDNQDDET
jgi:hypothetical protein